MAVRRVTAETAMNSPDPVDVPTALADGGEIVPDLLQEDGVSLVQLTTGILRAIVEAP